MPSNVCMKSGQYTCVYIYICMCTYIHTYTHTHIYIYICMCTYIHAYMYIYIYIYIYIRAWRWLLQFFQKAIYMHTRTNSDAYMFVFIHSYTAFVCLHIYDACLPPLISMNLRAHTKCGANTRTLEILVFRRFLHNSKPLVVSSLFGSFCCYIHIHTYMRECVFVFVFAFRRSKIRCQFLIKIQCQFLIKIQC
jgi:hypothetical protein